MEMGISEDVYSPVCKFNLANITYYSILLPNLLHKLIKKTATLFLQIAVFLLAFIVLLGAWLGFWAVRKLVLTEDGSIDTGVAHFVSWSFRIVASSMILQVPYI